MYVVPERKILVSPRDERTARQPGRCSYTERKAALNPLFRRAAAGLIAMTTLFMTLSACQKSAPVDDPDVSEDVQPSASASVVHHTDNRFTVRYHADYSFNPLTGTDPDNIALTPLLYEGLFVLDEDWTPHPVLCDDYETSDGLTYTMTLKPDITMTDGSSLTAQDVRYSLEQAAAVGRFAGRLHNIESVDAVNDLTVKITLKTASYKLPALLDIPIIKTNTIDYNHPVGTGPYYYESSGEPRLVAYSGYRITAACPL